MVESQPFGRYVLRRRLATGGMGEVYVADQTGVGDFKKPLALKVMLPTLVDDEKHVRLFLAEAKLAARLQHPNIVQVFDAGNIDGRYFLAMELVDGVTLGDVTKGLSRSKQHASVEVLCLVARQTLEALRYAHDLKDESGALLELVHRDISPSNILVSRRGEVKLTDFGIAKVRGAESNTAPGEVRGKLAYIAPELYRGATASVRSDLFALGVTLYRFAALASPYAGSDDADPLSNLMRRELVPLRTHRPDLPGSIVAAIERAMAPEPGDRFESATAMLDAFPRGDLEARQEALARLITGAPPPAPPVSLQTAGFELATATVLEPDPVPAPKRSARGPVIAAVAAALVVLGVAASVVLKPAPVTPPVVAVTPREPAPEPVAPVAPVAPVVVEPEPTPDPVEPAEPAPSPKPAKTITPRRAAQKQLSPPALLSVQASPWANVEINGRAVGQTPLARVPITSPTVTVRLTNPGYQPLERKLKLGAGSEYKVNETLIAR